MFDFYFIFALILAWLLDMVGSFGTIFCKGTQELFGLNIDIYGYYMIFFFVGLAGDIIHYIKKQRRKYLEDEII